MTTRDAACVTGGLSDPSKMPGRAFGLPAAGKACPVGHKLAKVEGTVCSRCYAMKNMYAFSTVQKAQERRYRKVQRALRDPFYRARWVESMVTLIRKQEWFRWHDSGDVFSLEYLKLIIDVVELTPGTRHWLPTRELFTIRRYQKECGEFPENLTVRLSLPKVDASLESAAKVAFAFHLPTSTVVTSDWTCPAPSQGNACGDCRACWDPTVANVSYRQH